MSKKYKILGGLLIVLILIWAFIIFMPTVAAKVIPSEQIRSNIARVAVALIATIVLYVVLILAIPILLKVGLVLVLGAVIYFAFKGLFKKEQSTVNPGDKLIP